MDLDSTMRKSVSHTRPENFYQRGYARSQGMVNQVTNLTDAVALLTQATEPLIHGKLHFKTENNAESISCTARNW